MANNRPVSYLQTDSKWSKTPYATKYESATIGGSGCGPTAMAMVIATWVDPKITPVDTCAWSLSHGYKATGNGTYHSYFAPQAAAYGLECYKVNSVSLAGLSRADSLPYHNEAYKAVQDGNLVICLMGKGNWTKGGHYILWYDVDGNDVLINDPASTKSIRTRNTHELLMQQVRFYWVVKVPKEVISMTNTDVINLINQKVAEANTKRIDAQIEARATEIADERIKAAKNALLGNEPSEWANSAWNKACGKGVFDGTNPKNMLTREQLALILDRLDLLNS